MKVCLIYGGNGPEARVSQSTSIAVLNALNELGYAVDVLFFDENIIENIQKLKPDVVFNAMHGKHGEDGTLQTILNFLRIPYTHSGRAASILAINKNESKHLAQSLGVPVCKWHLVTKNQLLSGVFPRFKKSFVKPCHEGSTVGCFKLFEENLTDEQKTIILNANNEFFLVEEFVQGIELTCGILQEEALGVIEVSPKSGYYDYNSKYTSGLTEYFIPPRISNEMIKNIEEYSLLMHNAVGASCVSRSDFILQGEDVYFLEINTHPGFTETSLVPKMANYKGYKFADIIDILLKNAKFESYEK